jgi:CzcA family heavy metal efflux pump
MFDKIISWSLNNKLAVVLAALLVVVFGTWSLLTMKVDILPDINKPTVTIFAEGEGMASEEVERLILAPIEGAVAGAPGVERIRGSATLGNAIVNLEFAWGTDQYRNRQIVQERLAQITLPSGVKPVLGPQSSLLGEVVWVGLTTENPAVTSMELRTIADWTVRPTLLKVPGVSTVLVMGGDVREWQINLNAERMRRSDIMLEDVRAKIASAITNKGGGVLSEGGKEYPIRIMVAPKDVGELREMAIGRNSTTGKVMRLGDIADVVEGPSPVRGSAAINGDLGVILRVIRQGDAETLKLTEQIDETLLALAPGLPEGVSLHGDLFRQEQFIRAGLGNVTGALRDGTILVVVILIIFLMNVRTTAITLTAIPLSILVTAIVFKQFGLSVNVMTLGGIAVAVGELVDDAIVGVENVFRRLRLWKKEGRKDERESVILSASSEVRNSIVYATILVAVVFLPIFFVPGLEGRLIASIGAAYLVSLAASMIVSLTVTPVLSALLLNDKSLAGHEEETRLVSVIKEWMSPRINWCIMHVKLLGTGIAIALVLTIGMYLFAGKEGIPTFNEGSATVMAFTPVGTDLATTNAYVAKVARAIEEVPGVAKVSNMTGRASADPHDGGSNASEMQILIAPEYIPDRERVFRDIQKVLNRFDGADFGLGQPITHRMQELLSGVRAPIAIKVFGDDPADMKRTADRVIEELRKQPGVKNAQIGKDTMVPEFRIYLDRNRLAEAGVSAGEVAEDLEMGLMGDTLGQVRLGSASVDVVARFDLESRGTKTSLRDIALPFAAVSSLGSAGDVTIEGGRNRYTHEAGKRVLVISANYEGRDVVGAVEQVKSVLDNERLPGGITLSYEGTYKSQKESTRRLALVFVFGIAMIFGILYHAFKSIPLVLLVMANIPTVLIGGMIGVWLTGGVINLAHLVGFISLAGIVSRNGIMLIGRVLALVREGKPFTPETVTLATLDRVTPVLMTSLVTALALVPLLLAGDDPGKELLHPLAVVVFGGLVSSTAISLFLTPALFYRFGKKAALQAKVDPSGF